MKKLSVLILSDDEAFSRNAGYYFRSHYSDEIRLMFCNTEEDILEFIKNNNVNLLLSDEGFENKIPEKAERYCTLGFLKGTSGHTIKNKSFCKYISGEELYKNIIFLCSEGAEDYWNDGNASGVPIYSFVSVNGCGATTLAISFAYSRVLKGEKVLFVGLDGLTDYSSLFSTYTEKGLSDIIYAVKSKNANVSMVAKSVTSKSEDGINFIDRCRLYDDINELTDEEVFGMLEKISSDEYDVIILDVNYFIESVWKYSAERSCAIYAVSRNEEISLRKTNNLMDSIVAKDFRDETDTSEKITCILNRSKSDEPCFELKCENIIYIPPVSARDYNSLIKQIGECSCWNEM